MVMFSSLMFLESGEAGLVFSVPGSAAFAMAACSTLQEKKGSPIL
jgi:hypothetical protein